MKKKEKEKKKCSNQSVIDVDAIAFILVCQSQGLTEPLVCRAKAVATCYPENQMYGGWPSGGARKTSSTTFWTGESFFLSSCVAVRAATFFFLFFFSAEQMTCLCQLKGVDIKRT